MTEFFDQTIKLWQNIVRGDYSKAFANAEASSLDRSHGYDRLPQPGYVGNAYEPGGILILGQNPGNDPIGKGESASDLYQYKLLVRLRDSEHQTDCRAAFLDLMTALRQTVMPTWPIFRNVVRPILSSLNLSFESIAYTNMVKFRTSDSSFEGNLYEWSWPATAEQIELLKPSAIIVLGKVVYEKQFLKKFKGSIPHFRVRRSRGDTRLPPDGKVDIDDIKARLIKMLLIRDQKS